MSLAIKWPPFDYTTFNDYYYLRIKTDAFVRVKVEAADGKQIGSDIMIVPTDDERVKIITIPVSCFGNTDILRETQTSLAEKASAILKYCKISENSTKDFWIPAFTKSQAQTQNHLLDNLQISDSLTIGP